MDDDGVVHHMPHHTTRHAIRCHGACPSRHTTHIGEDTAEHRTGLPSNTTSVSATTSAHPAIHTTTGMHRRIVDGECGTDEVMEGSAVPHTLCVCDGVDGSDDTDIVAAVMGRRDEWVERHRRCHVPTGVSSHGVANGMDTTVGWNGWRENGRVKGSRTLQHRGCVEECAGVRRRRMTKMVEIPGRWGCV